ncbi:MAG: glycosyltransferase family 2 protein, partial [Acidimicrobiia bacterium]|nr:glycosyltransferase family 2 protein [Acidimicrobiia bacterium]
MDPQPQAPSVVAVVVASDPGEWLEETLGALGAQDYPNLSVLVVDAGSDDGDLAARIAPVLPDAYVRRPEGSPGYGQAANEALLAIEGAAFYLFCHDDAAADPDAVRLLVEEALRSNAAVVGP